MNIQKIYIGTKSFLGATNLLETYQNSSVSSETTPKQSVVTKDTSLAPVPQDSFEKKPTNKNILDNVVKYSGVAALIGLGIYTIVTHKNSKNELSKLKNELQTLTKDIKDLSGSLENSKNDVNIISENISKLSEVLNKNLKETENIKNSTNNLSKQITDMAKLITAGGIGAAIIKGIDSARKIIQGRTTKPVSDTQAIWGNLYMNGEYAFDSTNEMAPETIEAMKAEITKAVSGKSIVTPMNKEDARLWSVSYETQFNNAGGQRDIAEQAPIAYSNAGIDTYGVAPLFDAVFDSKRPELGRTLTELDNGKYIYKTQCYKKGKPIELDKIYEGKTANGAKLRVFEGVVDNQKYLFVTDDKYFNYKNNHLKGGTSGDGGTVYADFPNDGNFEKLRIAQFNNLIYETLAAAKEGKIHRADGTILEAPNKMVAHEAWQSGGLLAKMRLYSIAEEADEHKPAEVTEYLRELADNTAIPIHNIGTGYQGRVWDRWMIKNYFDTLFDKYSSDIVNNAFIENIKDSKGNEVKIFGTKNQRIGFTEDYCNPAAISVALASKIGSVSEGYTEEITKQKLAGDDLQILLNVKKDNGGLVSFPNGVDKKEFASTPEVVEGLNKNFGSKLRSLLGEDADVEIRPYVQKYTDVKNEINATQFAKNKIHNKKLFVELLKDAVKHNNEESPLVMGTPNFFGNVDISKINENTPIFSMASRMDPQKGFDTAVVAYSKLMEKITDINKFSSGKKIEIPVLILSGGSKGDALDNSLVEMIKKIQHDYPKARILWTRSRISPSGLQLMNMTTTNTMPSDFEPYGISDLKGLYAGSHALVTEVGGMRASGNISRKIYPAEFEKDKNGNPIYSKIINTDTANALTVKDYKYMCLYDRNSQMGDIIRVRNDNANKLAEQMFAEMNLSKKDKTKLDLNAISLDVSWDKGATQNYLDILNIV